MCVRGGGEVVQACVSDRGSADVCMWFCTLVLLHV